jgi:hypothetical protein
MKSQKMRWDALAKASMESWLYLACWKERMQKDAISWIISREIGSNRNPEKTLSLRNIDPIKHARERLLANGYLREEPHPTNRHWKMLLSLPEPFIRSVEKELGERRRLGSRRRAKLALSNDEQAAIRKILDSAWFRELFTAYLEAEDDLGKQGALQTLGEFAADVFMISASLAPEEISPPVNAILESDTFDAFMKEWSATHIETNSNIRWIRPMLAFVGETWHKTYLDKQEDLLIKNALRHPYFAPFCIPRSLAKKMCRTERISISLAEIFTQALTAYHGRVEA